MKKSTLISLLILFSLNTNLFSQKRRQNKQKLSFNENLYNSINYRLIGPFRGGRAGTATGIINNNKTYYMGTAGGGVWKTLDAGNNMEMC